MIETWRLGDLETWRLGDLETWRLGDLETWRLEEFESLKHGLGHLDELNEDMNPLGCIFLSN